MVREAGVRWENWAGVRWVVGLLFAVPGMVVWLGTLAVLEYRYTFPGDPPVVRPEASLMIALFSLIAAALLIVGAASVFFGKANRNGWATFAWIAVTGLPAALAIGRAAWIHFVLLA